MSKRISWNQRHKVFFGLLAVAGIIAVLVILNRSEHPKSAAVAALAQVVGEIAPSSIRRTILADKIGELSQRVHQNHALLPVRAVSPA